MKKKRIFSLFLVILLLSLYIITFIVSLTTTKETSGLFFACIFSTFVIPITLYGYQLLIKNRRNKQDPFRKNNDLENDEEDKLK